MGERQAKVNEKRQCFKGWETLDILYLLLMVLMVLFMKLLIFDYC